MLLTIYTKEVIEAGKHKIVITCKLSGYGINEEYDHRLNNIENDPGIIQLALLLTPEKRFTVQLDPALPQVEAHTQALQAFRTANPALSTVWFHRVQETDKRFAFFQVDNSSMVAPLEPS